MVPNKALYMTKDIERLASFVNVPLRSPADPFDVMFSKGVCTVYCCYILNLTLMSPCDKC